MGLNGKTNEEKIWNYLYSKLKNNYGVAGLIGNLKAESGLSPINLQNTGNKKLGMTDEQYTSAVDNNSYTNFIKDSQGYGLCQWTYWNRKQNLLNYAKSKGVSIGDLEMQLDFLVTKELQVSYKSVWNKLINATSVRQASDVVLTEFEKPANQSESVKATRARYGQESYDKFVNTKDNNKEVANMAYKVAIDSGHGSNTAGKRSPEGYREHWITTTIAYYLDIALKRCGIETLKVAWNDKNGKDDSDVSLGNRQKLIKNAKCDISISCHANAHGSGSTYTTAQGIETFVHNSASKVKDSKSLANKVQAYLIKGTKQTDRKVKSSNLAMCNCAAMGTKASILIEYGFMTNKYEEELMKSESFCIECAEETAHGICDYLGITYRSGGSNTSASTPTTPSTNNTTTTTTRSNLKKGDNGADVKVLQENLNYLGYSCGTADGSFGTKTHNALVKFQKANKLTADGIYGNASKTKMTEAIAKKKTPTTSSSTTSTTSGYVHNGLDYSLVFSPSYYVNRYSDLRKAFGNDSKKLFSHFIANGMKEGRRAISTFDVQVYKSKNKDLQNAFGNNLPKYYEHYIRYGKKENRTAI